MNPDARDRAFLASLRVLFVEDDPEVRAQMASFLARRVKELFLAHDGVEGLELFREQRPDLVVTDVMMPRLDGLGMAQAIRELAPEVPILVTTAFDQSAHLLRAIETGVDHYVVKPVDSEQLERRLELCARQLRLEGQAALLEAETQRLRHQEALGILAQGLAHDLNNLLQAILGWGGLARAQAEPGSKVAAALAQMAASEEQGKALTERLMLLAEKELSKARAPLGSLVRDAVTEALRGSRVEVEFQLAGMELPLGFNPTQVEQLFRQLALNAREAMDGQGRLCVTSKVCPLAENNALVLPAGLYLHLNFEDEGPGMGEDLLPRIWDPYFTTKRQFSQKGLGLGLALCQSIVRLHGGALRVDSQVGRGSRFHVYLPLG